MCRVSMWAIGQTDRGSCPKKRWEPHLRTEDQKEAKVREDKGG